MLKTNAPSTSRRADSPAPRLVAGKVESPCQVKKPSRPSQPSSFSLSNPDVKKDLAILAAMVISAAALHDKSRALLSLANLCWQEEGGMIFVAKFVACAGPFVGGFGAVVYLWLKAMDKVSMAKKWSDYAKAVSAAVISILIICFGHAALCYVQPELNMMAKDLYKMWLGNTLLATSFLSSFVLGNLTRVMALRDYVEDHYLMAVTAAVSSVMAYANGYAIIHCFVFQSGTSMLTFWLFSWKCAGLALAVAGISAAVFLCMQKVRALDKLKHIKIWWRVVVPALILTIACLGIYWAYGDPSLSSRPVLRLFLIFSFAVCAVCGFACIFLWQKLISARKKKAD